jgi:TolB-like protein
MAGDHLIFAAAPKRLALLPFKVNAQKDLSFLRDGIYDMLATRLAEEGQVQVIERQVVAAALDSAAPSGAVTEALARKIGSELKADFVLFGSLTVLGENVSIDAKTVDVSGTRPTMTFFDQSPTLGGIIAKIDTIAADINRKLFGRTVAQKQPPPAPAAPPAATPQTSAGPPVADQSAAKSDMRAHPEKLLKQEGFISEGQGQSADSLLVGSSREVRQFRQKFWKSANFKHLINGLCLADVDGDGRIETVTVTPDAVIIYRAAQGRFQRVKEIAVKGSRKPIGVDAADINGNGKAEIFVTAQNAKKNVVTSFVLEFNGDNFVNITADSPWIYRVVPTPARGNILLGQRPRVNRPYSGKVYEMQWQNNEYIPGDIIKTPRETSLLGLTIGDIRNDGRETVVAYKKDDRPRIIGASGKVAWDGSDRYGGSMLHFDGPMREAGDQENRIYLPLRLIVWKPDRDQDSVVIAAKNFDLSGRKLEFRKFTKSEFVALTWDGIGLVPSWKTRQISGYIQDFAVGDFDNDGRPELVAAVVLKEGRAILSGDPKSTIIAYELGAMQKAATQQ